MKRIFYITALMLWGISATAQSDHDSLWQVWQDSQLPDTARLQAMAQLCGEIVRNYPDSALGLAQQLADEAVQKGLKKYEAQAIFLQGRAYSYKSDYVKTSDAYTRSLALFETLDDQYGIAQVLNYIVGLHVYKGAYEDAVQTGEKALMLARAINSQYLISGGSKALGHAYKKLGNPVKALEVFENGLHMAEAIDDQLTMGYNLHAIADIYVEQDQQEKGAQYHERSLKIYESLNDAMGISDILGHTATLSLKRGDYDAALANYSRSLKLGEEIGARVMIAENLIGIANVYIAKGDYDKASEHLDKAEKYTKGTGSQVSTIIIWLRRGEISRLKKEFSRAIQFCKQALASAEEMGEIELQRDACQCLYTSGKSSGLDKQALAYYERYILFNDSLNATETVRKLQQMEFSQQLLADSLEQEALLYKSELAHQKQIAKEVSQKRGFMYAGFFVLLLAGAQWSRLRYIRKSKSELQTEKDRSDELLLNILPADVAEELKANGKVAAKHFDNVSIIFTDFKAFTETSEHLSAAELVDELNYCFEGFDAIMEKHGVEKIKTIGDAYMAAGGLPVGSDLTIRNTVMAALEMQQFIADRTLKRDASDKFSFEMRLGIHTGPVIAGIVGSKKFQYDLWGDTVNTAARMESHAQTGRVNISRETYAHIKEDSLFRFEERPQVDVKGKGAMDMFYVSYSPEG